MSQFIPGIRRSACVFQTVGPPQLCFLALLCQDICQKKQGKKVLETVQNIFQDLDMIHGSDSNQMRAFARPVPERVCIKRQEARCDGLAVGSGAAIPTQISAVGLQRAGKANKRGFNIKAPPPWTACLCIVRLPL